LVGRASTIGRAIAVEGDKAPLVGLPTDERREWLTRSLDETEKALAELGGSASHAFGTTTKDLADLRDRLEAELAILRPDP
jgi:hypothetical protein